MNRYLTRCQATLGADLSIGLQTKLPKLPLAVLAGCRQIGVISLLALALGLAHLPAQSQEVNGSTTPVTESSSRPTLKLGSQGAAVAELQAILKLLGYYSAAVDGVYQESTATAVSAFQQAAGLRPDGIAGTETWERLLPSAPASQTTAQTGQATGQAGQATGQAGQATGQAGQATGQAGQATGQAGQTVAPTPTPSTSATPNPLSVPPSSSGFPAPTVAVPAPTPSPQPSPTPASTPAPTATTPSTGGYTPIAPAASPAPVTSTATSTGTSTAVTPGEYPVLRLGMEGVAVSQLQERLKANGFFSGVVDGVFGSETELAVQEAQRRYNLEPDGIVGPATWSALQGN